MSQPFSNINPPPVDLSPPPIRTYASKFPGSPEKQAFQRQQYNAKQQSILNNKHGGGVRKRKRKRNYFGGASGSPPNSAPSGWNDPDNPQWHDPDDPPPSYIRIPQSHTGIHQAGPDTANTASLMGNTALINGRAAAQYDSLVQYTPSMGQPLPGGSGTGSAPSSPSPSPSIGGRRRRRTRKKRKRQRPTRRRRRKVRRTRRRRKKRNRCWRRIKGGGRRQEKERARLGVDGVITYSDPGHFARLRAAHQHIKIAPTRKQKYNRWDYMTAKEKRDARKLEDGTMRRIQQQRKQDVDEAKALQNKRRRVAEEASSLVQRKKVQSQLSGNYVFSNGFTRRSKQGKKSKALAIHRRHTKHKKRTRRNKKGGCSSCLLY